MAENQIIPSETETNVGQYAEISAASETPAVVETQEKKEVFRLKPKKTKPEELKPEEPKKETQPIETKPVSQDLPFEFTPAEKTETPKTEPTATATPQTTDWREMLKNIDRKELLKELGVEEDDDFEKQFKQYRRNGGDPYKYLEAKTRDWSKTDDKSLTLQNMSEEYPDLTRDELEDLFNDTYKQGELFSEDENRLGNIKMKANAAKIRKEKIAEQQKFTIPDMQVNPDETIKKYQEQINRQQQENLQQANNKYLQHPDTIAMVESKKVTIPAGEFGSFNVAVNPDEITKYFTDSDTYRKTLLNEKGEPDVKRENTLAMIRIMGIDKYNEQLIKYGKQLATKALVEEGQNAVKPKPQTPIPEKPKPVWRSI